MKVLKYWLHHTTPTTPGQANPRQCPNINVVLWSHCSVTLQCQCSVCFLFSVGTLRRTQRENGRVTATRHQDSPKRSQPNRPILVPPPSLSSEITGRHQLQSTVLHRHNERQEMPLIGDFGVLAVSLRHKRAGLMPQSGSIDRARLGLLSLRLPWCQY